MYEMTLINVNTSLTQRSHHIPSSIQRPQNSALLFSSLKYRANTLFRKEILVATPLCVGLPIFVSCLENKASPLLLLTVVYSIIGLKNCPSHYRSIKDGFRDLDRMFEILENDQNNEYPLLEIDSEQGNIHTDTDTEIGQRSLPYSDYARCILCRETHESVESLMNKIKTANDHQFQAIKSGLNYQQTHWLNSKSHHYLEALFAAIPNPKNKENLLETFEQLKDTNIFHIQLLNMGIPLGQTLGSFSSSIPSPEHQNAIINYLESLSGEESINSVFNSIKDSKNEFQVEAIKLGLNQRFMTHPIWNNYAEVMLTLLRHRPENEEIQEANDRILSIPQRRRLGQWRLPDLEELGQALTGLYTSLAPDHLQQQASTNLNSLPRPFSVLISGGNCSELCETINYSKKAIEELRLPPEEVFAKPFFKDDYLAAKKVQFIKEHLPHNNDNHNREGVVIIANFARDPSLRNTEILNTIVRASCSKPPSDKLMNTSRN